MTREKNSTISVQGTAITILTRKSEGYISLTGMAKKFGGDALIYNWMRNRNTLEFLGIWEQINNPDFKGGEFATFRTQAGLNSFHLTPKKWSEATQAESLSRPNEIAIRQLKSLTAQGGIEALGSDDGEGK